MRTKLAVVLSMVACWVGLLAADALGTRRKAPPEVSYPVAKMVVSGSDVWFDPVVPNGGLTLSYSGPDGVVKEQTFAPGDVPHISVAPGMPDGVYTYELRVIPPGEKRTRTEPETAPAEPVNPPLVQTGSFQVSASQILSDKAGLDQEVALDIVHADDVYIQGGLGVGTDSIDGQVYTSDTIILRQQNVQIKFHDSSTLAGFPSNDWRLIANDPGSGGAEYFAIEDSTGAKVPFKVVAGAPTSSFHMDSSGRIGLNTATPALDLHVKRGDTPSFRLEQDASGGFTAQTWDIAANELQFYVRDFTGGSKLPFRIRPGAPTSSIDISATGNVGLGTASPARQLHLVGANAVFRMDRSADTAAFILVRTDASWNPLKTFVIGTNASGSNDGEFIINDLGIAVGGLGARRMTISNTGAVDFPGAAVTAGSFTETSSLAFKSNVQTLDQALDMVNRLRGVRFSWKQTGEPSVGLIAEEVEQVIPEVVRRAEDGGPATGVRYSGLVAVLVEAVKAQQQTIEEQRRRISELDQRLSELEARLK